MHRHLLFSMFLLLALAGPAVAGDKGSQNKAPAAKQLSGMSIVGNEEAPKSLYIVPWKRSEIGAQTSMDLMMTESAAPVDREEFIRQLDLHEISTGK